MLTLYLSLIESADDKLLFEEVYNQHKKSAFNYALNLLNNYQDAEEATQDMWMAVASGFDFIHTKDNEYIKAHILRITKNKAVDIMRKKQRSNYIIDDIEPDEIVNENSESDSTIFQVCSKISYEVIRDCINSLDEIYSEILIHYYLNTMKTREIAKLIGIKEGTARARLARGRFLLLSKLKERGIK